MLGPPAVGVTVSRRPLEDFRLWKGTFKDVSFVDLLINTQHQSPGCHQTNAACTPAVAQVIQYVRAS